MHTDPFKARRVPRRAFLKTLAFAAAPMILPTGAFGRDGQPGANGKLATGHIGVGPRGRFLLEQLREQAVAVSDVDDARLQLGASLTRPGTKTYTDYRELLARADIDAVVIASPDHWHAVHAVHACEQGKDVYLETPVCRSPIAGRKILRAAARFGSVVQSGGIARATPAFAALQAGLPALGAITEVACWGDANPANGTETPAATPPGLRWDQWLGPAPWRPYADGFADEGWRWRLDFGGGQIMRQGAQLFECVIAALGIPAEANVKISTSGAAPVSSAWDCPQPFQATFEFEQPALKLTWTQEAPQDAHSPGFEIRGANGNLAAHDLGPNFAVEAELLEKLPEADRKRGTDPLADWQRAAEKRTRPIAGLPEAVLAASLAALANASYRLGRPLAWDGAQGTCVNDATANRLIAEPGAGPWRI